ncbi:MAG: ISKra4 family transposase [Desulfobacteraceae bacterium]|nr:ISKra4 family transposase [Desulfobacteraceae bacterium]
MMRYLKQIACVPAVFLPFNTAALLLKILLGTEVSPTSIRNWVQCAGGEAMARLEKELADLKNRLPAAEGIEAEIAILPLLIEGDGVMVPFRPDGGSPEGKSVWKKIKVGIFARPGSRITRKVKEISFLARKRVTAVSGDIEAFKSRMRLASLKEGLPEAGVVVWLNDGGSGFRGVFHDLFAGRAQGIPDFCHAAQNLWKGALFWFDGRTVKAREWFDCARRRLRLGRAKGVVNEISGELKSDNLPDSVRNSLQNSVNYLEKHEDHTDYDRYKELGLPIGSGMVESACKRLIQQRFKGVGMRWSEDGFNNLLHLRLAWVNETYDELSEPICSPNS